MRNNFISIWFFVLLLLMSCERNEKVLQDNTYADEVNIRIKEFVLPTKEELFLRDYNIISSFVTDSSLDIIVAYNYRLHALDFFSLQNNFLKQVKLDMEGRNGILHDIEGLYMHTLDSIWIYNKGIVYLTDTTGIVKEKIDIGKLQNEEIIIQANFSTSRINLYYNKKRKSLFYTTRTGQNTNNPRFYVYEYFLQNNNVKKYELSGSDYDTNIWSSYGWKNAPNVTFSDDQILYNYPIESNIYTIILEDNAKQTYGGKSRYTKNTVRKMSKNIDFMDAERHKIENIHFFEIVYNPLLNLYFRIHVDKTDYLTNLDAFYQFCKKDMYLMIFNAKFEIIYETKMQSNRYSVINSWCTVNKGLLMMTNNFFFDIETEEDTILFDVIEPQIQDRIFNTLIHPVIL